jgi:hypothetical protein
MYRKKQAAAAAPGAMISDPAGNQCSALNPATGYCPGTQADIAAQQSAAAGLSSASVPGVAGGGGYYYTPPTGTSNTGSAVPTFTDNASWAQYVETALGSSGADATAAAIAKYLSGQPVTSDQQTIIEEAIALANKPPVAGANGDPPSINLTASSGPTPPAGGPAIIMPIPDGSGGWERVTFPDQAAVDAWNQWNATFAANHGGRTQAYRSEWNTELTSLGVVGTDGPLKPPSTVTGNPYDAK